MDNLTIQDVINKISSGTVRIPSFQRGFVWEPDDVTFFIDSVYKKYPIGSILLWRTREQLEVERDLGPFKLPKPEDQYPVDYVLDGQQRLTSLFTVFQNKLPAHEDVRWKDVYYIIGSSPSSQESAFVTLDSDEVDPAKHFPMNVLFNVVNYRKATDNMPADTAVEIDTLQQTFKDPFIPVQIFETDNRENIAIVFERINRAGVPLDPFQLLTAWSWGDDFDFQVRLNELEEEISPHGFKGLADNKKLIMKCLTGFILEDTSPQAIMSLNGPIIRDNFDDITKGIKGAIDFLKKELNVYSYENLPFPAMLVPLISFFGKSQRLTDHQREQIVRWFWRSCFSRRYSNDVNNKQRSDLKAMRKMIDNPDAALPDFRCQVDSSFFTETLFSPANAQTRTFILMLASNSPKSFLSGASVNLSDTMTKSASCEFHHIFPKKYLERNGISPKESGVLANFCFLNSSDNKQISDKAPSEYEKQIAASRLDKIMASALCPPGSLQMNYDQFIGNRTSILVDYASNLIA